MGDSKRKREMNQSGTESSAPPQVIRGERNTEANHATESLGSWIPPNGARQVDRSRVNLSITPAIAELLKEASEALGLSVSQIVLSVLLQGIPSIRAQIDAVRPKHSS